MNIFECCQGNDISDAQKLLGAVICDTVKMHLIIDVGLSYRYATVLNPVTSPEDEGGQIHISVVTVL